MDDAGSTRYQVMGFVIMRGVLYIISGFVFSIFTLVFVDIPAFQEPTIGILGKGKLRRPLPRDAILWVYYYHKSYIYTQILYYDM